MGSDAMKITEAVTAFCKIFVELYIGILQCQSPGKLDFCQFVFHVFETEFSIRFQKVQWLSHCFCLFEGCQRLIDSIEPDFTMGNSDLSGLLLRISFQSHSRIPDGFFVIMGVKEKLRHVVARKPILLIQLEMGLIGLSCLIVGF